MFFQYHLVDPKYHGKIFKKYKTLIIVLFTSEINCIDQIAVTQKSTELV